jgi:hypothetical protein
MNYKKIYFNIIDKAKNRISNEYSEQHHILPKCMGGKNTKDNLVKLTGREHFICHWLLWKFTEGIDKIKMGHAFGRMRYHNSTNRYYSSIGYEQAKKAHAISASMCHKGKILSEKELERRKNSNPNAKAVTINGITYKSKKEAWEKLHTTKRRLYAFLNGKITYSEMTHKGRYPASEETKKKIGDWSRGKTYEELIGIEKAKKLKEKRKLQMLNNKIKKS